MHGWLASFLPLYLRNYYGNEPLFENSKIVTSVYNQGFDGTLDKKVTDKMSFDGIADDKIADLKSPDYVNVMKVALNNSDAAIVNSEEIPQALAEYLETIEMPVLPYQNTETIQDAYLDFYQNKVLAEG